METDTANINHYDMKAKARCLLTTFVLLTKTTLLKANIKFIH